MRHRDVFDIHLFDSSLLARGEVSHVEYGATFILGAVSTAIMGQETIDLSLTLILGTKGCYIYFHLLSSLIV